MPSEFVRNRTLYLVAVRLPEGARDCPSVERLRAASRNDLDQTWEVVPRSLRLLPVIRDALRRFVDLVQDIAGVACLVGSGVEWIGELWPLGKRIAEEGFVSFAMVSACHPRRMTGDEAVDLVDILRRHHEGDQELAFAVVAHSVNPHFSPLDEPAAAIVRRRDRTCNGASECANAQQVG